MVVYEVGEDERPESVSGVALPSIPEPREPPAQVVMAANFVALCNQHMGFRAVQGGGMDGARIETAELHPAQEGCFRVALDCLSRYFGTYSPRKTDNVSVSEPVHGEVE